MFELIKKIINHDTWKTMAFFMIVLVVYGIFVLDVTYQNVIFISLAILLGLVFDYVLHVAQKAGRKRFPTSGLISSLIIVVLLPPGVTFIPLLVSILAAIASKHFLIYKNRHIFNPAAVGAIVAVFAFDLPLAWWPDAYIWLTILLGIFIAWRVKKFLQVGAFFLIYVLFFVVRGDLPVLDSSIFYLIPWFFGLFMLAEPMTSPAGKNKEIIFGITVGVLVWVFSSLPFFGFAPLVMALLGGNILKIFLMKV